MRCYMASFAILLALNACCPGVRNSALGNDAGTNAGTNVGTAGVAGAPTLPPTTRPAYAPTLATTPPPAPRPASASTLAPVPPPVPMPDSAPTLAPAPPSAPVPTFAPGPVVNRTPAGQAGSAFGNPGSAPLSPIADPNTGVPSNANAAAAANSRGDQWRYQWNNGNWRYWTPDNRWIYSNGTQWFNSEPPITTAPNASYPAQPAYGYYPSSPYPGPYRYTTGYGGYYGPVHQGGPYFGPGGYYGQPGVSIGLGFGHGIRIGF